MENAVQYINGKPHDLNRLALSGKGNTAYLGVVRGDQKNDNGETIYWAYWNHKGNFQYGLYASTDVLQAAWVANYARKCRPTVEDLDKSQNGMKGIRNKTQWVDVIGLEIPESFEYADAISAEEYNEVKNQAKVKYSKVTPKETNITEEYVARAVNTLLGPKVDVKTRIAIKNIVVANTEFYRTAEDVTNYVNDLVKYNFK